MGACISLSILFFNTSSFPQTTIECCQPRSNPQPCPSKVYPDVSPKRPEPFHYSYPMPRPFVIHESSEES